MQQLKYLSKQSLKLKPLFALLIILGISACGVKPTPAAPSVEPSAINTIEKRISNGADDIEEVASGYVTATSERLEFTKTDNNGNQLVGLRFRDIDIPEDATITNAQLFFTAARSTSARTRLTVKGLVKAQAFRTTENYLSNADTTQASNAWPPNAWTEVGTLDAYKTGNISNIVQELVDADDWRSGNALAFVISGEGDRSAESFEGNPEQAPSLLIEYDVDDTDEPGDSEAVPIIFDTDFGFDVDDAGALAVLNALENNGEADILAVMAVTTDPKSPGAIDAVNTYYGNPDIPIGRLDETPNDSKWDVACAFWKNKDTPCAELERYFIKDLAANFPNDLNTPEKVEALPFAVDLYRQTLANQPDNSVTVVAVGFMQNIDDLLESTPDQHSDLDGVELVEQKVKQLVIMGASHPGKDNDTDFNLTGGRDSKAGKRVVENWPTTIAFTPGNPKVCGGGSNGVVAGGTLSDDTPEANPVRKAYELFRGGPGRGRDAWDLCSVLYGVRGTAGPDGEEYFKVFNDEKVEIDNDGDHEWVEPGNDRHERVWRDGVMKNDRMKKILNDLLTQPPKK